MNNSNNITNSGSSSYEERLSPIGPPPSRRTFRLVEPPNPSQHSSMIHGINNSGHLDHIPNSIDELFGAEPSTPPRAAPPPPSNLASIPQRRISVNPPNAASPPVYPSLERPEERAQRNLEGLSVMGPGLIRFFGGVPPASSRSSSRVHPAGANPPSREVAIGAPSSSGVDPIALPVLVDGVWVQNRVKSCKRMHYPSPVKISGPRENGVVREYYAQDPVELNTLIVEGPISVKFEQSSGRAISIVVERNLPMEDDSSVVVYVTQFNAPIRIGEQDQECSQPFPALRSLRQVCTHRATGRRQQPPRARVLHQLPQE